ncbi:hypothetical protein ABIB94_007071 [Bradyrhizobium sp. JR7.2]|uniref:hypothetical protein n=1 Tax=Bradyrhizobium sp. JR7.2 TaxID=3156375 RepID=UPI0033932727
MSIAKIAYFATPGPNRYMIKFQLFGSDEIQSVEISKAHLANIIIDGASLALRETQYPNRVPETQIQESADERAGTQRTA